MKEIFVDETEWWDRVAMAVELLESRYPVERRRFVFEGRGIRWIGFQAKPPTETASQASSEVTAYVFNEVRDIEILRRLNQMPDEVPLKILQQPFCLYCPEQLSFVAINAPDRTLSEHIKNLLPQ